MLLIMGASGRVGGALAKVLEGQQTPMRLAGRRPDMVPFDLLDPETFDAALQGVTAVFLMRPPQIARGEAFRPFLDACVERGIRRMVVLSVKGAESNRVLPHHAMEQEVINRPFDWTMLRPGDFMQNLETVHREDIRIRDRIAVPAGRGKSAFLDVEDIGAAAALVLAGQGHEGRGYTLTGPEALSFDQVAAILSDTLGRTIAYSPPSVPGFVRARMSQGTPFGMALVMTALYSVQRFGGAAEVTGDLPLLLGRPAGDLANYVTRNAAIWAK
jgi:uncharacterized protein YbjT (DUF2867 family)